MITSNEGGKNMEDLYLLAKIDNTGNMDFYRSGRNCTIAVYTDYGVAKRIQTLYKHRNLSIVSVKSLEVLPND